MGQKNSLVSAFRVVPPWVHSSTPPRSLVLLEGCRCEGSKGGRFTAVCDTGYGLRISSRDDYYSMDVKEEDLTMCD
jgi:hypothetical protein